MIDTNMGLFHKITMSFCTTLDYPPIIKDSYMLPMR